MRNLLQCMHVRETLLKLLAISSSMRVFSLQCVIRSLIVSDPAISKGSMVTFRDSGSTRISTVIVCFSSIIDIKSSICLSIIIQRGLWGHLRYYPIPDNLNILFNYRCPLNLGTGNPSTDNPPNHSRKVRYSRRQSLRST